MKELSKEQKEQIEGEAEIIRAKYMPNGAINLNGKGLGDGKPQYKFEKKKMVEMLTEFASKYLLQNMEDKEEIKKLNRFLSGKYDKQAEDHLQSIEHKRIKDLEDGLNYILANSFEFHLIEERCKQLLNPK